ncbi:MAG: ribosome maturation factor RimP [Myxococcota bacterium]|nr:ribosome maturation factor RimP [Myxococcota bacterium]
MSKRKRNSRRRDASSASASQAPTTPLTDEIKIAIETWSEEAVDVVGVDLVDVEFSTPGQWLIRVYAQRSGNPGPGQGITIDQCAEVSRYIEAMFDADERVPERYTLEVSSPGIERDLKKLKHYRQVVGATVRVVLRDAIDGRYAFEGELTEVSEDGETIVLSGVQVDAGEDAIERLEVAFASIKRANTVYDFSSGK